MNRKLPTTHVHVLICAVCLVVGVARQAHAGMVFDTLAQPAGGTELVGVMNPAVCQGFVMGSGDVGMLLQGVTLDMADSMGDGIFLVSIYDSAGEEPGSLLMSLLGDTGPSTAGHRTYTPPAPFGLQPGAGYFVVASTTGSTVDYEWTFTSDDAPDIGAGSWGYLDAGAWVMYGTQPMSMQVNAELPEPGSALLMGCGLAAIAWRRRRKSLVRQPASPGSACRFTEP